MKTTITHKRLMLIAFSIGLLSLDTSAQSFAEKTAEIHLDYKTNPKPTVENLPTVSWIYPSTESTMSQQNQLEIEAALHSVIPIVSVKIRVSSSAGEMRGQTVVKEEEWKTGRIKRNVRLGDGTNNIELIVENAKGGIISGSRQVTIGLDAIADAISIDRKDYALMFATDKYESWDDLVNPINDAQTIKSELEKGYGFTTELVENANHEDVWAKMVDYTQRKYQPQDQLFIFFAGHGYFDETLNEGYVVATNSLKNDRGKASYVSYERLRSLVNNIDCQHIFLVMDVCFGGTFDPVVARSRGEAMETNVVSDAKFLARKLTYKTRRFLTSGGKEYVPDGRPGFR
jgi:hypothetical protein